MEPRPKDPDQHELTRFLNDLVRGKADAAETLMPFVYAELRGIAESHLRGQAPRHTLQPTALVHEAFLKLFDPDGVGWNDRTHFFALAAKAMRQVLVDHARRRQRLKRGGGGLSLTLDEHVAGQAGPGLDLLDLNAALEELSTLHERQGRIVELRYFGGLEVQEVAEVLAVSASTVEREWRTARAWLGVRLEALGA